MTRYIVMRFFQAILSLLVVMTLVFLTRMSAGYGLYWGTSTIVSGVQSFMLRRQLAIRR